MKMYRFTLVLAGLMLLSVLVMGHMAIWSSDVRWLMSALLMLIAAIIMAAIGDAIYKEAIRADA